MQVFDMIFPKKIYDYVYSTFFKFYGDKVTPNILLILIFQIA